MTTPSEYWTLYRAKHGVRSEKTQGITQRDSITFRQGNTGLAPDRRAQIVKEITRFMPGTLLAIPAITLIVGGILLASLQFTRDNPDSPYMLIGIGLVLIGAPFARAALLVLRSTQRFREWAAIAVYSSLLFFVNLMLGNVLPGTPGVVLRAALGILAAGSILLIAVRLYAKYRPGTRSS